MDQNTPKDIPLTMNGIRIWIPTLGVIAAAIFSYAISTFKVSALEDRVSSVEIRQTKYDENYYQLKDSVTEIKTILNERLPVKRTY